MLIYMDLCCFNRPFDDQNNKAIRLETEAKLFIQDMIKTKTIDLVWSYMIDYENSANPDVDTKKSIARWELLAQKVIMENHLVVEKANKIHSYGFGVKDSIHLACSINANAEYFITTDKGIIKKRNMVNDIKILNPIELIQLLEGS